MSLSRQEKKQQRQMKEELTKTQVLNLNDVEKVAKYEKSISKRPALLLAVIGATLIFSGASYTGVANIINQKNAPQVSEISRKEIPEEPIAKGVTCRYESLKAANGLDMVVVMNMHFEDDKLIGFDKVMNVVPTPGNEVVGLVTIKTLLPDYQAFENFPATGYKILSQATAEGFETKLSVDLKTVDYTKLIEAHKYNVVTKIEFALDDSMDTVMEKGQALGYNCMISDDK